MSLILPYLTLQITRVCLGLDPNKSRVHTSDIKVNNKKLATVVAPIIVNSARCLRLWSHRTLICTVQSGGLGK